MKILDEDDDYMEEEENNITLSEVEIKQLRKYCSKIESILEDIRDVLGGR